MLTSKEKLWVYGDGPGDRSTQRSEASSLYARQPQKCESGMVLVPAVTLMHWRDKMFIAQALGTVVGCIVNYITLTQVIDTKYMYLNGSKIDPSGQVSDSVIYEYRRNTAKIQNGNGFQWDGRKPQIFYSASV